MLSRQMAWNVFKSQKAIQREIWFSWIIAYCLYRVFRVPLGKSEKILPFFPAEPTCERACKHAVAKNDNWLKISFITFRKKKKMYAYVTAKENEIEFIGKKRIRFSECYVQDLCWAENPYFKGFGFQGLFVNLRTGHLGGPTY